MKSRYGLESNVFPDFMLWSVAFMLAGIEEKKNYKIYIASIFLGLCGYAYGTSYYFLPIFLTELLIILVKRKMIHIKTAFISLGIVFLICIPIMLMILINSFNLSEIHIGKITIPRLESNRYETLTVLSSNNITQTLFSNFKNSLIMLITQSDGFNANALKGYGIIYIFSLPIMIVGIIKSFKNNKELINMIFNIWFIVAFLLGFICKPNINRMNILYIPCIYFNILGICEISSNMKIAKIILGLIYVSTFMSFEITYFNTDFTKTFTFTSDVEEVIKYTKDIKADNIYFQYAFKEPYIYILFYNQVNPQEFKSKAKYKNDKKTFDSVKEFGKYKFYLPEELEKDGNNVYVILEEEKIKYEINNNLWKETNIGKFIVLEKR